MEAKWQCSLAMNCDERVNHLLNELVSCTKLCRSSYKWDGCSDGFLSSVSGLRNCFVLVFEYRFFLRQLWWNSFFEKIETNNLSLSRLRPHAIGPQRLLCDLWLCKCSFTRCESSERSVCCYCNILFGDFALIKEAIRSIRAVETAAHDSMPSGITWTLSCFPERQTHAAAIVEGRLPPISS